MQVAIVFLVTWLPFLTNQALTTVKVPTNWVPGSLNLTVPSIPVKNVGGCGGDWAFAATDVFEYKLYKQFNTYYSLSEQMCVDCARSSGCSGGWPHECFDFYLQNGVNFESVYPYKATAQTCAYKATSDSARGLDKSYAKPWFSIQADEKLLAYIVNQYGWVAVAINADPLISYKSGIVRGFSCAGFPDHVVVIVGYGYDTATKLNYWIIRNNWGPNWGEQGGYFRLERNVGACGLSSSYTNYRVYLS